MKNKKGFTLIELLAVIVILAIIALIAVPVIMNMIANARKSAFKDTAYGIINAGELYYSNQLLNINGMTEDVTIILPDTDNILNFKGEMPNGMVKINKNGNVALAVTNGKYCITKYYDDTDISISDSIVGCEIPSYPLLELSTISSRLGVTEIDKCAKEGTCAAGTAFAIKVNDTETYKFHVVSDDGEKVTLIMNQNLGDNVAWYAAASDSSYGPVTAVAALKERTSGWTNIEEQEYTYSDDGGGNKYKSFTETMRARMLTYTEATSDIIGCTTSNGSCPSWLYVNLYNTGSNTDDSGNDKYGYWTSAAVANHTVLANHIYYSGNISVLPTNTGRFGVRPVITLDKKRIFTLVSDFEIAEKFEIYKNSTHQISAVISPSNATNRKLVYESNDTSVATVSESGLITAIEMGTATITVTTTDGSNISKTITVNVVEPIMTSENACITSGTCSKADILSGITVNVKVNDSESHEFYVIEDTGTELTLIMSENLGDNVAWISAGDYTVVNTDQTSCATPATSCTDEGPITALYFLNQRTSGWTNVAEKEYTYSGLAEDGTTRIYDDITETMRVRMLTFSEATALGCTSSGSCPSWMCGNLYNTGSNTDDSGNTKYGYWTSTAISSPNYVAFTIQYSHAIQGQTVERMSYQTNHSGGGLRPVITLSKSLYLH